MAGPFTPVYDSERSPRNPENRAAYCTRLARTRRGRVKVVLPALETLIFEEPEAVRETIGPFIIARQFAGHPIAISRWEIE